MLRYLFWLLYIEHLYFQLIFSFNIACDEYIGYFLQLYMWVYKFLWKHSVDFVSMTGLPEFDLFTCIRSWEPLLTPNIPPPPSLIVSLVLGVESQFWLCASLYKVSVWVSDCLSMWVCESMSVWVCFLVFSSV